jgi:hypothetical protein
MANTSGPESLFHRSRRKRGMAIKEGGEVCVGEGCCCAAADYSSEDAEPPPILMGCLPPLFLGLRAHTPWLSTTGQLGHSTHRIGREMRHHLYRGSFTAVTESEMQGEG